MFSVISPSFWDLNTAVDPNLSTLLPFAHDSRNFLLQCTLSNYEDIHHSDWFLCVAGKSLLNLKGFPAFTTCFPVYSLHHWKHLQCTLPATGRLPPVRKQFCTSMTKRASLVPIFLLSTLTTIVKTHMKMPFSSIHCLNLPFY